MPCKERRPAHERKFLELYQLQPPNQLNQLTVIYIIRHICAATKYIPSFFHLASTNKILEMDHLITEAFRDVPEDDLSDTEDPDLLVGSLSIFHTEIIRVEYCIV